MSSHQVAIGPQGGDASLALRAGDEAQFRLAETPTTGYRWQAEIDGPVVLVADRFEGAAEPRGAGGSRVLTFAATAPGSAAVRLALRRAWGDPTPVATARIDVSIEE